MVSADRRDSQEASLRPGSCLFLVGVKNDTWKLRVVKDRNGLAIVHHVNETR